MSSGRNKYQSRENRARVRELFMREWDPIGVAGMPEAADEYDTYVDAAYVMLMDQNADAGAIAAFLTDIETRHMGLSSDDLLDRCNQTAKLLGCYEGGVYDVLSAQMDPSPSSAAPRMRGRSTSTCSSRG